MRAVRIAFAVLAWLFLAGVAVQVLLAGASLFELTDWTAHSGLGWTLPMVAIVLLVLAVAGRVERRVSVPTVALTVVAVIQPELAAARFDAPLVAAFHPLNAMLLFWLAWTVALRSLQLAGVTLPR